MKLIVTGFKRHGKDEVCKILKRRHGLTFVSSSIRACEIFLFDAIKDKYGYHSIPECFADRVNHRKEWFNLICEYNKDDKAKLGKGIFETSNIYCGLRNIEELKELRRIGAVDYVIWVDANQRKPPESLDSMTISAKDCDILLDNNRDLKRLEQEISNIMTILIRL